jgi:transcriptional regulator with XRE-family HTH domain
VALYPSRINDAAVPSYSNRHRKQPALVALGEAIRRLRDTAEVSQEELAFRAGMDRGYLGGIERGESNATILNVVKIAGAMNLTASQLLDQAGL